MTDTRTQLVVLFGGQSAEHDVSCVSARHVIAAANLSRYDIRPIAITRDGRWLDAIDAAAAVRNDPADLPPALNVNGPEVDPFSVIAKRSDSNIVVFPLLHGPMGEDGTVQGLLEVAGVAYVGCGVLASAVAMDKPTAKEILAFHSIPQVRWLSVNAGELADNKDDSTIENIINCLGFPIFVKPANMGSSIGISKATDHHSLLDAIQIACRYDEWIVCEEAVHAREIECAVIGNFEPQASVPGEIIPGAEFYDYEDKYSSGVAQLRIPADLPTQVINEMKTMAIRAFRALRCEGMARVDFFYEEGKRGILVNEVNTIPGFTPISMYPRLWEASGLTYSDLIDELVRLALDRHSRRSKQRRA